MPKTMKFRSEAATKTAVNLQLLAVAAMEYHNTLLTDEAQPTPSWTAARSNVLRAAIEFAIAAADEMRAIAAGAMPQIVTRTGDTARP